MRFLSSVAREINSFDATPRQNDPAAAALRVALQEDLPRLPAIQSLELLPVNHLPRRLVAAGVGGSGRPGLDPLQQRFRCNHGGHVSLDPVLRLLVDWFTGPDLEKGSGSEFQGLL